MFTFTQAKCVRIVNHPLLFSSNLCRAVEPRGIWLQSSCKYETRRHISSTSKRTLKEVHDVEGEHDLLDGYLENLISRKLSHAQTVSVHAVYQQYQAQAYSVIDRVVPYEEQPAYEKRADLIITGNRSETGNGLVTVVHAIWNKLSDRLEKVAVCSGFVVDASVHDSKQGDTVVTCAHTLEQIHGSLRAVNETDNGARRSLSFIVTASGEPRPVSRVLASLPRNDLIVLEVKPVHTSVPRLCSLPLTPFPVYTGTPLFTHLFGTPDPPIIKQSAARARPGSSAPSLNPNIEQAMSILDESAYTRLAHGTMLGYRSFSGLELEAGIHSSLPHILTSVLPTPGSSGGPMINAETGCVVGVISGRRMDNRVEGERGWGSSGEGVFEMFSLPGFQPTQEQMTWSR